MSISAQSITSFSNFKRIGAVRGIVAALVFAAGMSSPAEAAGQRPGVYDGTWTVVFTTKAGNCSSNNSAPFSVAGTQVSSAGGGKVTGGVTPGGTVSVHISVGLSAADGKGRLAGNSGTGRWNGVISGDRCSGTWQATRT
jgi:subtilisin family serine protease